MVEGSSLFSSFCCPKYCVTFSSIFGCLTTVAGSRSAFSFVVKLQLRQAFLKFHKLVSRFVTRWMMCLCLSRHCSRLFRFSNSLLETWLACGPCLCPYLHHPLDALAHLGWQVSVLASAIASFGVAPLGNNERAAAIPSTHLSHPSLHPYKANPISW